MTVAEEERNGQMPENTILSVKNIVKTYPGVIAINNFSMEVREGEVHALIGENGAGKSTLIKTLSGAITPDEGTVCVNGKDFTAMTPKLAKEQGIEVIYQEFTLVPGISAAENVFLGEKTKPGLFVDIKEREKRARELFERLNVDIDVSKPVKDLSPAHQQLVEIAKAVSKQVKILIMDEPTAPLTVSEVETLFRIIKDLKSRGVTIIYISHRLNELYDIADRTTVLRDGEHVGTVRMKETERAELIAMMVGRDLASYYTKNDNAKDEVVLEVKELSDGKMVKKVSFDLRKGEILGVSGLVGAGRSETVECLFGIRRKVRGTVRFKGREVDFRNPREAMANGFGMVPESRKEQGLFLQSGVRFNTTINVVPRFLKHFIWNRQAEDGIVEGKINDMHIRVTGPEQVVGKLSGGNQQKVLIGRWLCSTQSVLILDEPTRGVDVKTKSEIYALIDQLAASGMSIIMVSSELPEIINMSDRVLVMCNGYSTGILNRDELTQERIMTLATTEIGA